MVSSRHALGSNGEQETFILKRRPESIEMLIPVSAGRNGSHQANAGEASRERNSAVDLK
jgi:hypothetical protein